MRAIITHTRALCYNIFDILGSIRHVSAPTCLTCAALLLPTASCFYVCTVPAFNDLYVHISISLQCAAGLVINATDNGGNTALHLAARRGHDFSYDLIVKCGGKADLRNDKKETPAALLQQYTVTPGGKSKSGGKSQSAGEGGGVRNDRQLTPAIHAKMKRTQQHTRVAAATQPVELCDITADFPLAGSTREEINAFVVAAAERCEKLVGRGGNPEVHRTLTAFLDRSLDGEGFGEGSALESLHRTALESLHRIRGVVVPIDLSSERIRTACDRKWITVAGGLRRCRVRTAPMCGGGGGLNLFVQVELGVGEGLPGSSVFVECSGVSVESCGSGTGGNEQGLEMYELVLPSDIFVEHGDVYRVAMGDAAAGDGGEEKGGGAAPFNDLYVQLWLSDAGKG